MLRLYREYVEHMLVFLLAFRKRLPLNVTTQNVLMTDLVQEVNGNGDDGFVYDLTRRANRSQPHLKLDELIADVRKALGSHSLGEGDASLLDELVKITKLPFGSTRLPATFMASLRRAMLDPDEMTGLAATLRTTEQSCSGCNRPFHDREMATIMHGGTYISILCATCSPPRYHKCSSPGCDTLVNLPTSIVNGLAKLKPCAEHKEGATVAPPAALDTPAEPWVEEIHQRAHRPAEVRVPFRTRAVTIPQANLVDWGPLDPTTTTTADVAGWAGGEITFNNPNPPEEGR